jgi:hypothetical protein
MIEMGGRTEGRKGDWKGGREEGGRRKRVVDGEM